MYDNSTFLQPLHCKVNYFFLSSSCTSRLVFVDELVILVKEALEMTLVFFDKLGDVVLVLNVITSLVQSELFK